MHFLVSGRVQKVGFRAFVHKQALKLELRGWVRNLRDKERRVEALARGTEEQIEAFEEKLKQGPAQAEVLEVTKTRVEWDTSSSGFVIQPDGDQVWLNSP